MQYDVYRNVGSSGRRAPFLIDLQSDRIEALKLRVVAPLVQTDVLRGVSRLHPTMTVEGILCTLSISELFAIEPRRLGEAVDNLERYRHGIVAALDLLFTGV
ncbi:MAG TPA: CcdB family protein [Hyphomicrobiales bacterium]|nr:CcdB family protein [Hyphomicrobiales bacterium]